MEILTFNVSLLTVLIYTGTWGGGVYVSTDKGDNWTSKSKGLKDSALYVNYFALKGNLLFVATEGKGVYLSTDKGGNWAAINNGLNDIDALSPGCFVIIGNLIFLGTQKYPYLSIDNGNKWNLINGGFADFRWGYDIHEMATNCRYVFSTSWGDGVYRLNVNCTVDVLENVSNYIKISDIVISPNPFESNAEIQYTIEKPSIVTLSIYSSLGFEVIKLIDNSIIEQIGNNSITFDANGLSTGVYFCMLKKGDKIETQKFTVVK